MSTLPNFLSTASARGGICSRLPMSQTNAAASISSFFKCETASSSSSISRAVMATFAPISPSASAICSPRPREPPVIRAVLFFKLRSSRTVADKGSTFQLQGFILQKLFQAENAGLAAVARLLEAAERRVHVEGAAVDVDLAGADAARDALGARPALGPHRAREAVGAVVGDADRVFLVLVGNDGEHRPEDLLLGDAHAVLHLAEHRGPHVEAAGGHALGRFGAAREQLGAFLLPLLDIAAHALELRLRSQRPRPLRLG